jgi:hypothetical protein
MNPERIVSAMLLAARLVMAPGVGLDGKELEHPILKQAGGCHRK